MDIDFTIDGGAYCTLSPVVLSRGTIHAAGPYDCPNVRVRGRAVATNVAPHGAFRGFGAPQSIFALERHMDRVAAAVGLTPEDFRRRNFIRPGGTLAVGQTIKEPVDMAGLLDRALGSSDYRAKRERFARENAGRPSRRASASRRSCTAPASPAPAKCTCNRSSRSRRTPTGRPGTRLEHGDRAGHQHHLFADRRRRARHRRRRRRGGAARTRR